MFRSVLFLGLLLADPAMCVSVSFPGGPVQFNTQTQQRPESNTHLACEIQLQGTCIHSTKGTFSVIKVHSLLSTP